MNNSAKLVGKGGKVRFGELGMNAVSGAETSPPVRFCRVVSHVEMQLGLEALGQGRIKSPTLQGLDSLMTKKIVFLHNNG